MTFEVEIKFPLADGQPDQLRQQLVGLGATAGDGIKQCDRYFNHPSRNFAETDEAFRIRSVGEYNCVTYKGRILDAVAKTRHEIEIGLAAGRDAATGFGQILTQLGFRETLAVHKQRESFELVWEGRHTEVVLDDVKTLGWFAEIETMAQEADRDEARNVIVRLANHFGFSEFERRSYLQLLLEKDLPPSADTISHSE